MRAVRGSSIGSSAGGTVAWSETFIIGNITVWGGRFQVSVLGNPCGSSRSNTWRRCAVQACSARSREEQEHGGGRAVRVRTQPTTTNHSTKINELGRTGELGETFTPGEGAGRKVPSKLSV